MKWRLWWGSVLVGLLAACSSNSVQTLSSPKASPSVLPSPFAMAWQQECGLGSQLPPAGIMGIAVMPSVVGGPSDGQLWAQGLMRSLAVERWADANNQDTVLSSGCIESVSNANTEVLAIARAKASGGYVDYEPGTISKMTVIAANTKEMAAGPKGDTYVLEVNGVGPAGLWVVDAQGTRTAQGGQLVAPSAGFQMLYLGHYDSQIGVWVQDVVFVCSIDTPCS